MACEETEKKFFTFLWKLENISYSLQKKGKRLTSPAFVVNALEDSKWTLWLYPRGESDENYIGCFLHREVDSKGADELKIKFELAIIGKSGSVLKSNGYSKSVFAKDAAFGYSEFEKREYVYISRKSEFLPQDTLIIRCKMCKSVGELTEDVQCTAYTRIGVEKRNFLWDVKEFSTFQLQEKHKFQIKSTKNYSPIFFIELCLTGGLSSEEIIRFELSRSDKTIKFSSLNLFLIDVSGNKVQCNYDEFWFEIDDVKQLTFYFTKQQLLAKKSVYLLDDVLQLHFECAFSKGVVFEELEEAYHGCNISGNKILHYQNASGETIVPFSGNMNSLYDEQFLCDVKLQTSTNTFPAHKIILSSSSSVFKAMFSNDMKEKESNCVKIEDLSDNTVRGMLLYIYTARIEYLTWETASQLYVAADKYAITTLKNTCASFLKENVSSSSACDVLLLADLHSDDDLKTAIQDYILKCGKEIINSTEWKLLMETNSKLAAETLCLRYQ